VAVADEINARVVLLGTPSEEGGGGKIDLIEAGYFDDVHAAMMVSPVAERSLGGHVPRG
jgi:metal-dependent amidase/aminoacylase/carboxypeptidase family protein